MLEESRVRGFEVLGTRRSALQGDTNSDAV